MRPLLLRMKQLLLETKRKHWADKGDSHSPKPHPVAFTSCDTMFIDLHTFSVSIRVQKENLCIAYTKPLT